MSSRQHDRLSSETTEQRQARLRQMSSRQCDRLASESTEERDELLDEQRLHQGERESSSQLVSNSSVQMKMRTFHAHFATLTSPKCLESFPHVQIYLQVLLYVSMQSILTAYSHNQYITSTNNFMVSQLPAFNGRIGACACSGYQALSPA